MSTSSLILWLCFVFFIDILFFFWFNRLKILFYKLYECYLCFIHILTLKKFTILIYKCNHQKYKMQSIILLKQINTLKTRLLKIRYVKLIHWNSKTVKHDRFFHYFELHMTRSQCKKSIKNWHNIPDIQIRLCILRTEKNNKYAKLRNVHAIIFCTNKIY